MLFFSKKKNMKDDSNEDNLLLNGVLLARPKNNVSVKDRVLGQTADKKLVVCNPAAPASYCQNILLFGRPKAGKTTTFLIPSIQSMLAAGESILVADPDGEMLNVAGDAFKLYGYNVRVLNFMDTNESDKWSPLTKGQKYDSLEDVQSIATFIANTIMPNVVTDRASNISKAIHALILASVMRVCMDNRYNTTLGTCWNIINNCQDPAFARMFFDNKKLDGKIRACLGPYKTFEVQHQKTPADIEQALRDISAPFTTQSMQNLFSDNEFDFKSMATNETPCAYFVTFPKGLNPYKAITALFVRTALVACLGVPNSEYLRPVNIIMDGISDVGFIHSLPALINSATQSQHPIRVWGTLQSVSDLIRIYPSDWQRLLLAFNTQIGIGFSDATTAKYYSALSASLNDNNKKGKKNGFRSVMRKKAEQIEPFSAIELLQAKADEEYIIVRGAGQIKCKHRPI